MAVCRKPLLLLIGGDAGTIDYAENYVFWTIIIGEIPTVVSPVCGHLIRSMGYPKQASIGMILGALLNIGLDPLFMFVLLPPGNEVTGATIATALSNSIALVYYVISFRKNKVLGDRPKPESGTGKILVEIVRGGLPSFCMIALAMLSNCFLNSMISSLGSEAVAGLGIVRKIDQLAYAVNQEKGARQRRCNRCVYCSRIKGGLHMSQVFDSRPYMAERKLQDPVTDSDPTQFPHEEYVPEGAHLLTGLKDEWGYNVDIRRTVYKCKSRRQLEMIALVPMKDDPDETCTWPCVVYSQGSAFHEEWLCNHLIRHIRLASNGYGVVIAQYRPSETAPFPAQAQDVKSAIRFVRKNAELFHVDPERIAIAGDSSGGHTALMAGFTGDGVLDDGVYGDVSCKVNCIVDCYGPTIFSLMNYWPSSQNHWDSKSPEGYEIGIKNVLEEMEETDKTIPMNYLSEDKPVPPTLIINGSRDMLVPAAQSTLLYETMKKLGKEVKYYHIVDGNHGFIGWNNDTVLNIVVDFLKEHI